MKIESSDKTISDILSMGFYKIPRFQRPYSWERAEVEDFWQDTIVDSDADYFIGSLVIYREGRHTFGVVDGQQRLTTITMLLCAIRDAMRENALETLADGLHQLIERPDIDNKRQCVLWTETSYPYLQAHIQKITGVPKPEATSQEERQLAHAFEFIGHQIRSTVTAISTDPTLKEDEKPKRIEGKLKQIRDRILQLTCVVVTLDTEDDAYVIFETLNTRGKDLTLSDLVRTHLTKLLPKKHKDFDPPKERFNEIRESFAASASEIDPDSFILHFWLSRYDYTAKKKIYKALKRRVRKDDALSFLDALVEDAHIYRIMNEPSFKKWPIEEGEVRLALEALGVFRIQQAFPFILSLLRCYFSKRLKLKQVRRALAAIENFHFVFTAITSQRSSGGISAMYALHARDLEKANTDEGRIEEIDALIRKLRDKRPTFDEFLPNVRELRASETVTSRKRLVQYVLGKMASHHVEGVAIDPTLMTIEHLAAQSQPPGGLAPDVVSQIGNLAWVSDKLQAKLGTKPVEKKCDLLRENGLWVDDILRVECKQWNEHAIRKRTEHLASIAYNHVWKL